MNDHTVSGKFDQVKGKIKQSVGEAVGDEKMANSGAADQVKGAAKEGFGHVKDAARSLRNDGAASSQTTVAGTHETTTGSSAGHDVRQKIVSTAQNVKDAIKNKADGVRDKHTA